MKSNALLKGFISVCLGLLLLVSLSATHSLAALFIPNDKIAWAFALAIELGIIGLGVGIYQATITGQDPKPYTYTLVGVLALSLLANFLHGADTFNPAARTFTWIRSLPVWWLLPLVMVAPVPILVLRMTELATRLWLSTAEAPNATTNTQIEQPTTNPQFPQLVIEVIRIYQQQPATPLPKLAELLEVSATEASRLRLQAMTLGLLERKTRGYYLPLRPVDQIMLTDGDTRQSNS
jgi:hypothetical protein